MNSKLIEAPALTIRASAIHSPSSTVFFLENLLAGERPVDPAQPTDNLGQPSSYASRFVARHAGLGILAFVGGHVESMRGGQVVDRAPGGTRGKAVYPQSEVVWTPDPATNPN